MEGFRLLGKVEGQVVPPGAAQRRLDKRAPHDLIRRDREYPWPASELVASLVRPPPSRSGREGAEFVLVLDHLPLLRLEQLLVLERPLQRRLHLHLAEL